MIESKFSAAPILGHYNPERTCLVETDASDFVTSGILSQPDDNQIMHPIAFISAKMTPAECNYSIEDKELLAIVKAFKTWRAYLEGNPHRIEVSVRLGAGPGQGGACFFTDRPAPTGQNRRGPR